MTNDRAAVSSSDETSKAIRAGRPKLASARRRRGASLTAASLEAFYQALSAGTLRGGIRPGNRVLFGTVRAPRVRPAENPPGLEARLRGVDELPEDVRELWRAFIRDGCAQARNGLVCAYQGLVGEIAGRFAARLPPTVERSDLENAGNLGLIGAIGSFEPERGIRFEAYAETRIRGSLLDELRVQDWLPRPFRRRFQRRKRVFERLRCDLGREPHDDEVAEAMGVDPEEYQSLFGIGLPGLDAPVAATKAGPQSSKPDRPQALDAIQDGRQPSPDERLGTEELLAMISESLTEQEFRVLYLRYWQDKPMREIGEHLSLSESRVWKIHARMIERLGERFAPLA